MKNKPLVKHSSHEVVILPSGNSTHAAKYHCCTCNKFVAWLSQQEYARAKELGLINDLDLQAQHY